jgi:hypothetical protein
VTINGRVESENKQIQIAGKDSTVIGGKVISNGSHAFISCTGGSVSIVGSGLVVADGNVDIASAPGKPTFINCRLHSRRMNVFINRRSQPPGNVSLGKNDTISARKEVKIWVDILHISGTIIANTLQKHANHVVIDSTARIKTKHKAKDLAKKKHKTKEKTDGRVGEKSSDCQTTGLDNSLIDFNTSPLAIDADNYVRVATGPGDTIDFRGNYPGWAVITCPGTIDLFSDFILTEPGVTINQICGPGPVMTNPSMPIKDVATCNSLNGSAYPGMPVEVEFVVSNMGNGVDTFDIIVNDSLGWPYMVSDDVLVLDPYSTPDSFVTVALDVPTTAVPESDTNKVWLLASSRTDPTSEYECIYPNPFNPAVNIRFTIPPPGGVTKISIFDVSGKLVRTIFKGKLNDGLYKMVWNGRNSNGEPVGSGLYLYLIEFGSMRTGGKMILLR